MPKRRKITPRSGPPAHRDPGTLDALRKNRSITLNTLNGLCGLLDCGIEDIIQYIPDKN